MPKFSKKAIMDALQASIDKEREEYERKIAEAPKKLDDYEEKRKEWEREFLKWKAEAPVKFQEFLDEVTLQKLDEHWAYYSRHLSPFGLPFIPAKPQELQSSLIEKSAHCSRTERALMRVSLMMEAKDGSIVLHERDEIFSYQLIPCR